MAVKDLVAAMNDVPERIGKIASGLPYRDFVTVGLLVDKASVKRYLMGKRISVKRGKRHCFRTVGFMCRSGR